MYKQSAEFETRIRKWLAIYLRLIFQAHKVFYSNAISEYHTRIASYKLRYDSIVIVAYFPTFISSQTFVYLFILIL